MIGALIAFWGMIIPFKIPLILIFLLTILIAWIIGLIYERLLVRPLINSSLVGIIMVIVAALTLLENTVDIATGKFPIRVPHYGGDISFYFLNNKVHLSNLRELRSFTTSLWSTSNLWERRGYCGYPQSVANSLDEGLEETLMLHGRDCFRNWG